MDENRIDIIKRIDDSYESSIGRIISHSKNSVPKFLDGIEIRKCKSYRYKSEIRNIEPNETIIEVKGLLLSGNGNNQPAYIELLKSAIDKGYIRAFLLFINNKFIKWSDITMIKDLTYTYLSLKNFSEKIKSFEILSIPSAFEYSEGKKIDKENTIHFSLDGLYQDNNSDNIYTSIRFISNAIALEKLDILDKIELVDEELELFDILSKNNIPDCESIISNIIDEFDGKTRVVLDQSKDLDNYNLLFKDNIIGFDKNGYLINKDEILESFDEFGLGHFCTVYSEFLEPGNVYMIFANLEYGKNTLIKFDIDNYGIVNNFKSNRLKLFYSSYLISNIDKLFSMNGFIYNDTFLTLLFNDYKSNMNKLFSHRINHDIRYVNDFIYKDRTLVDIYEFKLEDNLHLVNYKTKRLNLSKIFFKELPVHVMIFKDNRLYEYYHTIEYKDDKISVLVDLDDLKGHFEVLYFKYIKNNHASIKVPDFVNDIYISQYYDVDNCNLFSIDLPNKLFPVSGSELIEESTVKYEVKAQFKKVNNKDNTYNITFDEPFYYNRNLFISHNRQFRYCYYQIANPCVGVALSSDFKFCHNKNKYMVFINGKLISNDNIIITVMDNNNPFDELALYTSVVLNKNDLIEIFYLPFELNDIHDGSELSEDGLISVSNDQLFKMQMGLDKKLFMYFLNGKKIHKSQLYEINSQLIKIGENLYSTKDLKIFKLVDSETIINDEFGGIGINRIPDNITSVTNNLMMIDKGNLFNILGVADNILSNIDPIVNTPLVNMEKLKLEIYKNFYSEFGSSEINYVNDGETSATPTDVDMGGNYVIDSSDANNEDKVPLNRDNTNDGSEVRTYEQ